VDLFFLGVSQQVASSPPEMQRLQGLDFSHPAFFFRQLVQAFDTWARLALLGPFLSEENGLVISRSSVL